MCVEVIKMAILKDEILAEFITELREKALSEFRQSEKENQNRYDRVMRLSMKFTDILSRVGEEESKAIQNYMDEKDSLTGDELDYLYLQGIKDCCKMLKILKII